ncbi:hypothetical protein Vafri_5370 [Volvox africanus]|nr:hypothetical protein Vafri_5370 [Volvox africanus]
MEPVNQFRAKVQQILDKECKVDWGKEGKYWGIISKYDATHPEAPWTIYYPRDGDEENGVFTPDFAQWHVEDEENPKDPFTIRYILTWKDEKPTSLPEPPDELDNMEFEPILGRREELPHNQSSNSEGSTDKGGDNNENGDAESSSEDGEEEGPNGSGPGARRPSVGGSMSRQLIVPARLPPKLSARRPNSQPDRKLRRSASASGLAPGGSQSQGDEQQGGKRKPGRPRKHILPGGEQPPAKRLRGRTPKNSSAPAGPGSNVGGDNAAVKDKAPRMRKLTTAAPVDGVTGKPPTSDALGSSGVGGGCSAGRSGSAEPATVSQKPRRLVRLDSDELDDKQQDAKLPIQKGPVKAAAAAEDDGAGQSPSSPSSDEGSPRDGGDATASTGLKAAKAVASDAAQVQGQAAKAGPSPDGKRVVGTGRPKPLLSEEQLAKRKMSFGTAAPARAGLLGVVPTARMQREAAHAGTVKLEGPLAKPTVKATLSKPASTGPGTGNSQSQSTIMAGAAAQSKAAHVAASMGPAGLAAAVAEAADGNNSAAGDAPVGSAAGSQEAPLGAPSPALEEQPKAANISSRSLSQQQQNQASVSGPSGTTVAPLAALPQTLLPPSLLTPLGSPPIISKVSLPSLPVVSLPPRIASSASLAAVASPHALPAPQSASPAAAAASTATTAGNTATLSASKADLQLPLQQDSQQQDSQQQDLQQLPLPLSQSQGHQPGVSSQLSQRGPQTTATGIIESPPPKGPKQAAATAAVRSAYLPPAAASTPVAPALLVTPAVVATATLPARPALPPTAALAALIPVATVATASLPAATSTTLPTATTPVAAAAAATTTTATAVAVIPTALPIAGGAAGGGSAAEALAAASNAAIASGATPETAHTDVQQLLDQLLGRALDALTNSQNAIKSTANSAILMAKAVGANRVARGFFSKLQLLGDEVALLAPEGCTGDATGCERVALVLAKRLNVFYVMDSMLQRSAKEAVISSWPKWVNSGLQASVRLKVFTEHHLKSVRKVTDVWKKRNLLDTKVLEMADLILKEQESKLKSSMATTAMAGALASAGAAAAIAVDVPVPGGIPAVSAALPQMHGGPDGACVVEAPDGVSGEGPAALRLGQGGAQAIRRRRQYCMVMPRPPTLARISYPMGEYEMYYINRFGPMTNRCYIENPYGSMGDVRDEATGELVAKLIDVDLSEDEDEPDFSGTVAWREVISVQLPQFNEDSPHRGGLPTAKVTPPHPSLEEELRRTAQGLSKTPVASVRQNLAPKFLTPIPPGLLSGASTAGSVGAAVAPVSLAPATVPASAPPAVRPSGTAIVNLTPPANDLDDLDTWAYGGEPAPTSAGLAEVSAAQAAAPVSTAAAAASVVAAATSGSRSAEEDVQPNIYDMPAAPSHEVASTGRRADWEDMDMDMDTSENEDGEWQPPLPSAQPPPPSCAAPPPLERPAPVPPPGTGLAPLAGLLQPSAPGRGVGAPDGLLAMMGPGPMGFPLGLPPPPFMMGMPPVPALWPGQPPLPHPLTAPLQQQPLPPLPPLPPHGPPPHGPSPHGPPLHGLPPHGPPPHGPPPSASPPLPPELFPLPPPPDGPPSPPPPLPCNPPLPSGGSPPPLPPPVPALPPLPPSPPMSPPPPMPPMPPLPPAGSGHSTMDDMHLPPLPPDAPPQPPISKPALPPSPITHPPLPSDGLLLEKSQHAHNKTPASIPPHLRPVPFTAASEKTTCTTTVPAAVSPQQLPSAAAAAKVVTTTAAADTPAALPAPAALEAAVAAPAPQPDAADGLQQPPARAPVQSPAVPQSQQGGEIVLCAAPTVTGVASCSASGAEQSCSLEDLKREQEGDKVREDRDRDKGRERARGKEIRERGKEGRSREERERAKQGKEHKDKERGHKRDRTSRGGPEERQQEEEEHQQEQQVMARDRQLKPQVSPPSQSQQLSSQYWDRERERERVSEGDRLDKDTGWERERDRDKDRERDKDWDKDRERDWDRERERARDGGRGVLQREVDRERDPWEREPPRQQQVQLPLQQQPSSGGSRDARRRYDDRDLRDWPPPKPLVGSPCDREWDPRDADRDPRDWDGNLIRIRERGGDTWDRGGPPRSSGGNRSRREPEPMRGGAPGPPLPQHSHPHLHMRGYREAEWDLPRDPLPPHMRGPHPPPTGPGRGGPGPGGGRPPSPPPHGRYGYRDSPVREPPPPLGPQHSGDYAVANGRGGRGPPRHSGGDPVLDPPYREGPVGGYVRPPYSNQYGDEGAGGADGRRKTIGGLKRPMGQAILPDKPAAVQLDGDRDRDRDPQAQKRERKKARQRREERNRQHGEREEGGFSRREENEDGEDGEEGEEGELPEPEGPRSAGAVATKEHRERHSTHAGGSSGRGRGRPGGAEVEGEAEEGEVELPQHPLSGARQQARPPRSPSTSTTPAQRIHTSQFAPNPGSDSTPRAPDPAAIMALASVSTDPAPSHLASTHQPSDNKLGQLAAQSHAHKGDGQQGQDPNQAQAQSQGQGQPSRKRNVITFNLAPRDSREGFTVTAQPLRLKASSPSAAAVPVTAGGRPTPFPSTQGSLHGTQGSGGSGNGSGSTSKAAVQPARGPGISPSSHQQQEGGVSPRPPRAPLTLGPQQGGAGGGAAGEAKIRGARDSN